MTGFAIILFMLGLCLCWVVGTKVKDRGSAEKPESLDSDEESVAVRRVQEEGQARGTPAGSSSTDGEDLGWASATEREEEGEQESDVGSVNNDDFVELKERSHVPADSETSSAPAVASGRERLLSAMIPQGKAPVSDEREEMIVPLFTRMRMGRRKKRKKTGRSMEEDD